MHRRRPARHRRSARRRRRTRARWSAGGRPGRPRSPRRGRSTEPARCAAADEQGGHLEAARLGHGQVVDHRPASYRQRSRGPRRGAGSGPAPRWCDVPGAGRARASTRPAPPARPGRRERRRWASPRRPPSPARSPRRRRSSARRLSSRTSAPPRPLRRRRSTLSVRAGSATACTRSGSPAVAIGRRISSAIGPLCGPPASFSPAPALGLVVGFDVAMAARACTRAASHGRRSWDTAVAPACRSRRSQHVVVAALVRDAIEGPARDWWCRCSPCRRSLR